MKKQLIFRYIFWFLALGTAIAIFFFSAQSGDTSSNTSSGAIAFLLRLFYPDFDTIDPEMQLQMIAALQTPIRKLAHFSVYTLLGFFTAGALFTYRLPRVQAAGAAFALAVCRAGLDEIHQGFVPNRGPALTDVCIDAAGALTGILLLSLLYIIYVRRKNIV